MHKNMPQRTFFVKFSLNLSYFTRKKDWQGVCPLHVLFTLCFSSITFNSGLLAHSKKITREALAHFCAVGLKAVVRRHQECSKRLQLGIEELGLEMFVQREEERLSTVNTIKVPFGVDWKKVAEYAMRK